MTTARYVRLLGFVPSADHLTLSQIGAYAGATLLTPSAISCSDSPASGVIDNLIDGSDATTATFTDFEHPWFWIQLDFGAPLDLTALSLGNEAGTVRAVMLMFSTDGETWSAAHRVVNPKASLSRLLWSETFATVWTDGFTRGDAYGWYRALTTAREPVLTAHADFPGGALRWDGGASPPQCIYFADPTPFLFGFSDFTVRLRAIAESGISAYARLFETAAYNGAARGLVFYMDPSGRLAVLVSSASGGNAMLSDSMVALGAVFDLVVERYGNTLRMYVNGAVQASSIDLTGVSIGAVRAVFGAHMTNFPPTGETWKGYIGQLEVHRGALFGAASFTLPSPAHERLSNLALIQPQGTVLAVRAGAESGGDPFSGFDSVSVDVHRRVGGIDLPVANARVSLFRIADKHLARVKWSDTEGACIFENIDTQQFRFVAITEYPTNPADPSSEDYLRPVAGVSKLRGEA